MGKPGARSILYRLIEAGQLARRASLVPLRDRGLEAGDDAVLFLLKKRLGATEAEVMLALDLDRDALEPRIERLVDHDLIARRAIGPELAPGLALTDRGESFRELLEQNWSELEGALVGELGKKHKRLVRRALGRFIELLRL